MHNFLISFMVGCTLISIAFSFCYLYGGESPKPNVVYYGFFCGIGIGAIIFAMFFGLKDILGK